MAAGQDVRRSEATAAAATVIKYWVTVPANTKATMHIPASSPEDVTEGGEWHPAAKASGVTFLSMHSGVALFEVGSGTYVFSSRMQ